MNAKEINKRRKRAGVSYRKLARELSYAVSTVHDVLLGRRTSEPLLRNVARYLDRIQRGE